MDPVIASAVITVLGGIILAVVTSRNARKESDHRAERAAELQQSKSEADAKAAREAAETRFREEQASAAQKAQEKYAEIVQAAYHEAERVRHEIEEARATQMAEKNAEIGGLRAQLAAATAEIERLRTTKGTS